MDVIWIRFAFYLDSNLDWIKVVFDWKLIWSLMIISRRIRIIISIRTKEGARHSF